MVIFFTAQTCLGSAYHVRQTFISGPVQGGAKIWAPGLVNFVPAVVNYWARKYYIHRLREYEAKNCVLLPAVGWRTQFCFFDHIAVPNPRNLTPWMPP